MTISTPFPLSGKVYDIDGSTVVANAKVVAYDYTILHYKFKWRIYS